MPTRVPSPPQFELFEGFLPTIERSPKLGLPFQKSNTVDVKRAAAIFHVSPQTILRMREQGHLRGYKFDGAGNYWQIEYSSVVEYCNRLRVHHAISDRRAPLAANRKRHTDSELLPFSIADTITVHDATKRLDCSPSHILALIEAGTLVAYQVQLETPASPWRIYEPSLDRYVAKLHEQANQTPSSRRRPSAN